MPLKASSSEAIPASHIVNFSLINSHLANVDKVGIDKVRNSIILLGVDKVKLTKWNCRNGN